MFMARGEAWKGLRIVGVVAWIRKYGDVAGNWGHGCGCYKGHITFILKNSHYFYSKNSKTISSNPDLVSRSWRQQHWLKLLSTHLKAQCNLSAHQVQIQFKMHGFYFIFQNAKIGIKFNVTIVAFFNQEQSNFQGYY